MLPELGTFAIILALCFALIQGVAPLFERKTTPFESNIIPIAVIGQFIFLTFAMLSLIICFLKNDLSVLFVREHSHHLLPVIYRIGAAWGGHEGSLLLWCLILSGWTLVFMLFSNIKNTNIFIILGLLNAGFILFLFATSNPFKRDFPHSLIVGNDLTPILQDPGLILHPPMLYSGYVGFVIGFAFAITALITGKFDKAWARACRPWIIVPWSLLSCGIVLGSWWAYRELGWGGWWFWDPVENASLLPWLSATALIHCLIVTEKRDVFKGWTILLAIITFALCLLGTFLVRSGVLVSVHAFASDPTRGIFLLAYLALIIGGALLLYSWRVKDFYQTPQFQLFSRETLLLINSIVFLSAIVTIIIGTLYPIILDALNLEKISVGEPYFNTIFVPIMLPLLLLMGFAPHVNWNQQTWQKIWKKLRIHFFASLIIGFLVPRLLGFPFHLLASLGMSVAVWIILATLQHMYQLREKFSLAHAAMIVAHLGIAILVLGISLNKAYSEERQVKMATGEKASLGGYEFILKNIKEHAGPNYQSLTATFEVHSAHIFINQVVAEQRIYTHQQFLSKTGILANWWRDLYVALGSPLPDSSWSVRIYFKPFVRWIWFGGLMLLAGGLLSLLSFIKKRGVKHEYS